MKTINHKQWLEDIQLGTTQGDFYSYRLAELWANKAEERINEGVETRDALKDTLEETLTKVNLEIDELKHAERIRRPDIQKATEIIKKHWALYY